MRAIKQVLSYAGAGWASAWMCSSPAVPGLCWGRAILCQPRQASTGESGRRAGRMHVWARGSCGEGVLGGGSGLSLVRRHLCMMLRRNEWNLFPFSLGLPGHVADLFPGPTCLRKAKALDMRTLHVATTPNAGRRKALARAGASCQVSMHRSPASTDRSAHKHWTRLRNPADSTGKPSLFLITERDWRRPQERNQQG